MGNTTKEDLTFTSTDSLLTELAKRHDALVVLGMRFTTKDGYNITRYHRGHRYVCLGMLSNAQSLINNVENEHLRDSVEN